MFSFTHLLMRTRSVQDLLDRTTSRGMLAATLHLSGWSTQNSTQPIGGRVDGPVDTNSGGSGVAPAGAVPASRATAQPAASIAPYLEVICSPLRPSWGYIPTELLVCR